jgi:hypothetical protein
VVQDGGNSGRYRPNDQQETQTQGTGKSVHGFSGVGGGVEGRRPTVVCPDAGATAPPGRHMVNAGAIVSGGLGTTEAKKAAMADAGIVVAETPSEMGQPLLKA